MFFRYVLFNAITIFLIAYSIQFHDALNWVMTNDITRISLLISVAYFGVMAYLLPSVMGRGTTPLGKKLSTVRFIGNTFMGLGLVGTVAAMIHLFQTIGVVTDAKVAIPLIMVGIGTAQITTLFGLGSALLLSIHQFFVFGDSEDAT